MNTYDVFSFALEGLMKETAVDTILASPTSTWMSMIIILDYIILKN